MIRFVEPVPEPLNHFEVCTLTMATTEPLDIDYFSDLLCIWAYAAEARVLELEQAFGASVRVARRYCSVFGDTATRIEKGWSDRGGYQGFNRHVLEVASQFDHIEVSPTLWLDSQPPSSAGVHLFLSAVRLAEQNFWQPVDRECSPSEQAAWELRLAFFRDARNIARADVQDEIAKRLALPATAVRDEIASGRAYAALSADLAACERLLVHGSPTFILNDGRQKLYGNVGYRVIEANVQELLSAPTRGQASWC